MKQKGFTLIEIMVAMSVGSVLLMGAVFSIHQVLTGTDRSNSQIEALTDINYAALAIKNDLMVTQQTDLIDGSPVPQSSVNLTWTDYTSFGSDNQTRDHYSIYALSDTNLIRTYDGTASIVGRQITSLGFTQNGRVISVFISATGPGASKRSETLRFTTYLRIEELEE